MQDYDKDASFMKDPIINHALSVRGIVSNIIAYLPWKEQVTTCRLVSKVWCMASDEPRSEPITLHVEDRVTDFTWRFPEKYRLRGEAWKEQHFPLWRLPMMPDTIASRVTKLTIVPIFSPDFENCYDLCDYHSVDGKHNLLLPRFTSLEDLTVLSDFNAANVFFRENNFVPSYRPYKSTAFPPTLKRLAYYETFDASSRPYDIPVEGPGCRRIKHLVSLAPNLETFECPGNTLINGELIDFLPLAGSLKRLNLRGCSGLTDDSQSAETIFHKFPHLEAWNFSGTPLEERSNISVSQRIDLFHEGCIRYQNHETSIDPRYKGDFSLIMCPYYRILARFIVDCRARHLTRMERNLVGGEPNRWITERDPAWPDLMRDSPNSNMTRLIVEDSLWLRKFMKLGDQSCVSVDHIRRRAKVFKYYYEWNPEAVDDRCRGFFRNRNCGFYRTEIKRACQAMKRRRRKRLTREAVKSFRKSVRSKFMALSKFFCIPAPLSQDQNI